MTTNPRLTLPIRREVILHAPVLKANVQRKDPAWQTFGPDDKNFLATYRDLLDALGIEDPSDTGVGSPRRAVDLLQHAVSLRASSRAITRSKIDPDAELKRKLATGEIDRNTWTKHLAKTPTTKELAEMRKRDADMLGAAGLSAFRIGCRAIREVGEERWMEILKPIAAEAVATKNQRRWADVHALATFLRDPDIGALARALHGPRPLRDLPAMYFRFGRFDLYYIWRAERAKQTWEMRNVHSGDHYAFITVGIKGQAPSPTMVDFDPSWEPGLYSAEEAVANAKAISRRQEDEIDTASPERKSMVRANV